MWKMSMSVLKRSTMSSYLGFRDIIHRLCVVYAFVLVLFVSKCDVFVCCDF